MKVCLLDPSASRRVTRYDSLKVWLLRLGPKCCLSKKAILKGFTDRKQLLLKSLKLPLNHQLTQTTAGFLEFKLSPPLPYLFFCCSTNPPFFVSLASSRRRPSAMRLNLSFRNGTSKVFAGSVCPARTFWDRNGEQKRSCQDERENYCLYVICA